MADVYNEERTRGVTSKRGARKEAIIQVAAQLFAERGVKKTSIARLMDGAHLTRELFYYYFEDKEELVSEVVDLYVRDVFQLIDEKIEVAQETIDPSDDFLGQITMTVQGVRCVINGIDETHEGRLAAIMESGLATESARRIVNYFVSALFDTDSYRYYARENGDLTPLQLELVLTGIAGMVIARPDLTDGEIGLAAQAAMRGSSK